LVVVAADLEALFRPDTSFEAIKAKMLIKTASWNLVRTLHLGAPPFRAAFAQYLAALRRGDEPRAAWAAALRGHDITPERLEAEYQATADRWISDFETKAIASRPPAEAEARPMSEAEVHVLWARVAPWKGDHLKRVGAELDDAVNADPNYAPAYLLRGEWRAVAQGQPAESLADLRKGAALAPGDVRATYALARYLDFYRRQNPVAKAEVGGELHPLVEGLRQTATSAPAWNFLALVDSREGQHDRALASARKAIAADPSCFECYDTVAIVLQRLGRFDEAVAAQRTGVHLMPEGAAEPGMLDHLVALKRELAVRATPGAPRPKTPTNAPPSESPPAAPEPAPPSESTL
jgi:tetratricopeptide (TPR) repeat protein